MTRTRLIQMTGAAVCGAVCAGALFGVTIAAGRTAAGVTGAASDWVLPLLAGVTVACVAWVLMDGEGAHRSGETRLGADTLTHCSACGGAIHSDWRLCPHCGERLTPIGRPFTGR